LSDPPSLDRLHDALQAALKIEQHEYHAAIGRLMLKWAQIERVLYMVLLHYGKLSDPVGRAVLSGTRATTMIDFLKAIAHNKRLSTARVNDLECVFSQIGAINTMRDRIAHFGSWGFQGVFDGVSHTFDQWISNEERSSRGPASSFMIRVNRESIDFMIADLDTISQHLHRHLRKKFLPHRPLTDASTWLYKSPQPVRRKGRAGAIAHKRSARRRPSHE
jgi:hypothetical protein